jgi:hypothetical protein
VASTKPVAVTQASTTPAPVTPAAPIATEPTPTTPAAGKAAEAIAPVVLTLPKETALTADHLAAVKAFAEQHKLSSDAAQAVLEQQHALLAQQKQIAEAQHTEQVTAWDEALKADKDLAGVDGTKLEASLNLGRRALEKFGDKELIDALRTSGHNSFPPLVKLLVKIGRAMGEDNVSTGAAANSASDLRSIYSSMPNA